MLLVDLGLESFAICVSTSDRRLFVLEKDLERRNISKSRIPLPLCLQGSVLEQTEASARRRHLLLPLLPLSKRRLGRLRANKLHLEIVRLHGTLEFIVGSLELDDARSRRRGSLLKSGVPTLELAGFGSCQVDITTKLVPLRRGVPFADGEVGSGPRDFDS